MKLRYWFLVPCIVLSGCAWSSDFQGFKEEHTAWKIQQAEAEEAFQFSVAEQQQNLLIEARAIINDEALTKEEAEQQLTLVDGIVEAKIAEAEAKKKKEQAEADEVLTLKAELAKQQSDAKTKAALETLVEATVSTAFGAKTGTAVSTALEGAVKIAVGEEIEAGAFATKLTSEVNDALKENGRQLPEGTEAAGAAALAWLITMLNNRRRNASREKGNHFPKGLTTNGNN